MNLSISSGGFDEVQEALEVPCFKYYYLNNVISRRRFAVSFDLMHEVLYVTQVVHCEASSALFLQDQASSRADVERQFNCISHYTYAKYY